MALCECHATKGLVSCNCDELYEGFIRAFDLKSGEDFVRGADDKIEYWHGHTPVLGISMWLHLHDRAQVQGIAAEITEVQYRLWTQRALAVIWGTLPAPFAVPPDDLD